MSLKWLWKQIRNCLMLNVSTGMENHSISVSITLLLCIPKLFSKREAVWKWTWNQSFQWFCLWFDFDVQCNFLLESRSNRRLLAGIEGILSKQMFNYSIDINFLTKIIINIHLIDELFFIALITIIRVMTSCTRSFLVVSIANTV